MIRLAGVADNDCGDLADIYYVGITYLLGAGIYNSRSVVLYPVTHTILYNYTHHPSGPTTNIHKFHQYLKVWTMSNDSTKV